MRLSNETSVVLCAAWFDLWLCLFQERMFTVKNGQ